MNHRSQGQEVLRIDPTTDARSPSPTVPMVSPSLLEPALAEPPDPAPSDGPVSILLVDDRHDKLLALQAVLADLGENLVLAHSGTEALRCLLKQDFALILLDVSMPVIDGFETAALIRQRKHSELTPIIFISAISNSETHVSRGYSLGAVDYILTPIVPEVLRAKVSFFVDLFKKNQLLRRQAEERAQLVREQTARAEAEAAERRAAFLAEISQALMTPLETPEILEMVANLTVPHFADACLVDRATDGEAIRLTAWRSSASTPGPLPDLAAEFDPIPPDSDLLVAKVFSTGKVQLLGEFFRFLGGMAPAHLDTGARCGRLLRLGARSAILVPVMRGQAVKAAITFALVQPNRVYGPADVGLAEALARSVAVAWERADLYQAAQAARREAEAANRAKDRFIAMLSHELRTPLTPILFSASTLATDPTLPEAIREDIRIISRNAELEARLIDDLLDITRITQGKLHLSFTRADAHTLVRSALDICTADIDRKNLVITTDLRAGFHLIDADEARLQQVFWNLIKNAIKFTPAGGEIRLESFNADGRRLCVQVTDTGAGIAAELLPRIFEPFERGQQTNSDGLGLGLAISRAIIELHGGAISARSAGIGHGATFVVELPVIVEPAAQPSAPRIEHDVGITSSPPRPRPPRVLVVDDHPDTLAVIQKLLRRLGYAVNTADGVESALQAATQEIFDVVISDLGLQDGTGHELVQRLRRCGREVPSIAVSGYGMKEDIARSRSAGFAAHLTKPISSRLLQDTIERLLTGG
ncbi:MAG: response regulator [Verrucomicrobia bacterium]|nr:response regulator [Verrucomicrobiota bacterium]